MSQLKMYRLPAAPVVEYALPEGYRIVRYRGPEDKMPWCECCRAGLISDEAGEETFDSCIQNHADICMETDVFFLDWQNEHVGTITAVFHPDGRWGEVHMVGMRPDFRGKGLGKYLNAVALKKLAAQDVRYIMLTTDEWRKPAIRSYLAAGFLPVEYDTGMRERWLGVMAELDLNHLDMLDEEARAVSPLIR